MGVPGILVTPIGCDRSQVLIFMHGGGFALGSSASHRKLAGHIAKALGDALKDALAVDDSRFYPWFLDIRTAGVPGTCEVLLLPMPMKGGIREEDHQPVPA